MGRPDCIERDCQMCQDAGEPCIHCLRAMLVRVVDDHHLFQEKFWPGYVVDARDLLAFGQEDRDA